LFAPPRALPPGSSSSSSRVKAVKTGLGQTPAGRQPRHAATRDQHTDALFRAGFRHGACRIEVAQRMAAIEIRTQQAAGPRLFPLARASGKAGRRRAAATPNPMVILQPS
jgi:hypothetical protein